jgi:tripartite-type tricarboxylate transporter receptor subunit TctC
MIWPKPMVAIGRRHPSARVRHANAMTRNTQQARRPDTMNTLNRRRFTVLLAAGTAVPSLALAQAEWKPTKPVRLIVNLPPGTSADVVARAVAGPLSAALGHSVVVENRAGAAGVVGAEVAARAAPDGYTILMTAGSTQAIVPLITKKLPYDPVKDLVPVAAAARLALFLVTRSEMPFKDFAGLIEHARKNPGRLTFGTPGNGSSPHIAGEMLNSQAGISTLHVPYKGSAPALLDLLAGNIDFVFDPGIAFEHVRAGKLRLLGVGVLRRTPLFPDTPTLHELGLKGFDTGTTNGFWAPAGTPKAAIDRYNREINRALVVPAVAEVIRGLGAEPTPMSPAEFGALTWADKARFAKIIEERKITVD